MICSNCGKEFEGKFCPECGTPFEEVLEEQDEQLVEEPLRECPECGQERLDEGKFCVNCGFNYETGCSRNDDGGQSEVEQSDEKKSGLSVALRIIAKVYRYLLAGGMLFVGLVAFLALTSPAITVEFFGLKSNLCSGFVAIGRGSNCDVPYSVTGVSITLLIVSILILAYGARLTYFAFKKPYSTVGKKQYWIADGVISLVLIVLGEIVSSVATSEDGKVGSGFAMCIVMGFFGLLTLVARIYYELKVFDWSDTGLSEEEIAKSLEKKPKKQRLPKPSPAENKVDDEDVEVEHMDGICAPEVQVAKKRKHRILALDWIIALIPLIFVSIMLIIDFTPAKYSGNLLSNYLLYGGISMGAVFIICVFIRLVNEVQVYKWVDPYPNKKLPKKKKLIITLVVLAVLVVTIVPSVVVSSNIFRVDKVSQISLGMSRSIVRQILGDPYGGDVNASVFEYYSDDYKKLEQQYESAQNSWDFDNMYTIEQKLENLTYKYIRVEFTNGSVTSVLLDTKARASSTSTRKSIKSYQVTNASLNNYYYINITYWVKYNDGSYYTTKVNTSYSYSGASGASWQDPYGNTLVYTKS